MPVALRTKKRHRAYALKIFNAAKRAKLIVANPAEDVEGYRGRKNDDGQIHVLPPEQVTSLLSAAVDAEIRPLAVRAAATLRFTSSIPFFTILPLENAFNFAAVSWNAFSSSRVRR
jgi:hypothetical protein